MQPKHYCSLLLTLLLHTDCQFHSLSRYSSLNNTSSLNCHRVAKQRRVKCTLSTLRVLKMSAIVHGLWFFVKGAKLWCELHRSQSKWSMNPCSVHVHTFVYVSAVYLWTWDSAETTGRCKLASQPDRCALARAWEYGASNWPAIQH